MASALKGRIGVGWEGAELGDELRRRGPVVEGCGEGRSSSSSSSRSISRTGMRRGASNEMDL